MRTIPFLLSTFALTFTGVVGRTQRVAPKQTTLPERQQRQVLHDFRNEQTGSPLRIPPATEKSVLSQVFRKYLTHESQCNPQFDAGGESDSLAAARKAGQIVPAIDDIATGSFTAPGKTETAYVIFVAECNASHADNFGTKRVAIFSSERLIANVDADFMRNFVRKMDLDGDGINELLMTGGDMNQGTVVELAALVDFKDGKRRVIQDFGTVLENSCASGFPGSAVKASVVSIGEGQPRSMPRLHIDNYASSCRKTKRWRFVSTGKMQD